MDRVG